MSLAATNTNHNATVYGVMRRRWLPPAVPVDEEAEVMSKLAAVIIKSPANEEDNVAAMIDSTEKIFDAILDRECKLATLERLLKARNPPPCTAQNHQLVCAD
jgi:hypothetical protein